MWHLFLLPNVNGIDAIYKNHQNEKSPRATRRTYGEQPGIVQLRGINMKKKWPLTWVAGNKPGWGSGYWNWSGKLRLIK